MKKEQATAIANDLRSSINAALQKQNLHDFTLLYAVNPDKSMTIRLIPPGTPSPVITPNAVRRYKLAMPVIGLPALGATILCGGAWFQMAGLSSDGKRVKTLIAGGTTVHDLPLEQVMKAVKESVAKELAKLDTSDAVTAVDEAAALLSIFFKKQA